MDFSKHRQIITNFCGPNWQLGVIPLKYDKQYDNVEFREIQEEQNSIKNLWCLLITSKQQLQGDWRVRRILNQKASSAQDLYKLAYYYEIKSKLLIEQEYAWNGLNQLQLQQQSVKLSKLTLNEREKYIEIVKSYKIDPQISMKSRKS
ncbi:unnamed protein product [Paramecium octaurelia]|uniref:Uncharacterized protein n=1 Tax=Paramecium octaurelia TaxID=43137 RepID=A0A8S1UYC9_PAROT|nr:unnamed protein product [Paramecium octaurelia]